MLVLVLRENITPNKDFLEKRVVMAYTRCAVDTKSWHYEPILLSSRKTWETALRCRMDMSLKSEISASLLNSFSFFEFKKRKRCI